MKESGISHWSDISTKKNHQRFQWPKINSRKSQHNSYWSQIIQPNLKLITKNIKRNKLTIGTGHFWENVFGVLPKVGFKSTKSA